MRILFMVVASLCISFKLCAQLPEVYLKAKQSQALGALSKTAPLVVVIDNEKSEHDAALISAVKEHWHIGPVKYMSYLEFALKFKSQTLDPANLYLYNNYTVDLKYSGGGVIVTMNPGRINTIPAIYKGFYLTNEPNKLVNSLKYKNAPPFLFFSATMLADKKNIPIQGFYSLMIKNFNYDMRYCQNDENFNPKKKKKRKKRQHGVYFFRSDSLSDKTVLLVKEQTYPKDKKTKEQDVKKSQTAGKKRELSSDQYAIKKTVVVFPEDIAYAVKKNDAEIMLFSGDSMYSALDGSVYATIRGHSGGIRFGVYLSLLLSICSIAFFVIAIQR